MQTDSRTPLIVVIDDEDPFLALMHDFLEAEGYRVVTGSVAHDAVPLIRATRPALVVLDLVIKTEEAGLDVLREMRATPAIASTPVIICTADHAFVRTRGAEMRAMGEEVIAKPFALQDFLDLVQRRLSHRA